MSWGRVPTTWSCSIPRQASPPVGPVDDDARREPRGGRPMPSTGDPLGVGDVPGADLAPRRTCARCQMLVRGPTLTSASRSAVGWTRAVGSIMAPHDSSGRGRGAYSPGPPGQAARHAAGTLGCALHRSRSTHVRERRSQRTRRGGCARRERRRRVVAGSPPWSPSSLLGLVVVGVATRVARPSGPLPTFIPRRSRRGARGVRAGDLDPGPAHGARRRHGHRDRRGRRDLPREPGSACSTRTRCGSARASPRARGQSASGPRREAG